MHFNYNPYLQLPYNEKDFYLFKDNVEKHYGIFLKVVNETKIEKIYRYEDEKTIITVYLREDIGGLTISSKQLEAVLEEEKENEK